MKLLHNLGCLVSHYRKTTLVIWTVAVVILSVFAAKLPAVLSGNGFDMVGEAAQVESELFDTFNIPDCTFIVLFESEQLTTDNIRFRGLVGRILTELEAVPEIVTVRSPYQHAEMLHEHLAFAVLAVEGDVKAAIEQVRTIIADAVEPDIQIKLTGEPVVEADINQASQHDLVRAELIGIPTALIILLFAFGSVVAACIPLLIGIVTVSMAMGILYLLDTWLQLSIFLLNVTPMIGLALSIDFALLIVSRFREQLNHTESRQAVIKAVATAGHSIALSGVCMFLGLSALLFFQIDIFIDIAIGGMVVVGLAVLSALTLLPALLALLGHKIDAGRLFKVRDKSQRSYWAVWALYVLKRPVRILIITLLVLFACLLPLREIQLQIPEYTTLPAGFESREALETIENTFGQGEIYPVNIIVTTDGDLMQLDNLGAAHTLVSKLTDDPEVERVESLFSYLENRSPQEIYYLDTNPATKELIAPVVDQLVNYNKTLLKVYLNIAPTSAAARKWVKSWSEETLDVQIMLGGKTKFEQEVYSEIEKKVPYAMTFILVSIFLILLLAFRSILIPIKAILMNILSLSATFGILVWIFQMGHLDWLLQFEPEPIGVIIPIFIFSIVLCLSIDYEIFLMSRIYEEYRKIGNHNTAIYFGLTKTSRIITSAAAIIIVITGAFAFTGVVIVKQMGLGMALAILIDATLVRMILVPAILKLLGKTSWWLPFTSSKTR